MAENEIRIKDLPSAQQINETDDVIVLDNATDGTRKLQGKVLLDMIHSAMAKGTASGAVASFTDGADGIPMTDLVVSIEPQQSGSGDPSPTNIRPISGWTACNVVNDAVYGGYINWNQLVQTANRNLSFSFTESASFQQTNYLTGSISTISAHKYLFVANIQRTISTNNGVIFSLSSSGTLAAQVLLTNNESNGKKSAIWVSNGQTLNTYTINNYGYKRGYDSGDSVSANDVQLIDLTQALGTTVADYIYSLEQATPGSGVAYFESLFYKDYYPYNSGEITNVSAVNGDTDKYNTYTINFVDGSSPLTVYGGTLDVLSGLLTIDRAYSNITTVTRKTSTNRFVFPQFTNMLLENTDDQTPPSTFLCNRYKMRSIRNVVVSGSTGLAISSTSNGFYLYDPNLAELTEAQMETYLTNNPLQVLYPLETPQTYQLTPTQVKSLLGVNNIWADTGNILNAEYVRDTTTIINQILARLDALES